MSRGLGAEQRRILAYLQEHRGDSYEEGWVSLGTLLVVLHEDDEIMVPLSVALPAMLEQNLVPFAEWRAGITKPDGPPIVTAPVSRRKRHSEAESARRALNSLQARGLVELAHWTGWDAYSRDRLYARAAGPDQPG